MDQSIALVLGMLVSCLFSCTDPLSDHQNATLQSAQSEEPTVETNSYEIDTSTSYLMGRFDPSTRAEFILIDTVYADRAGLYLRRDVYDAFKNMWAAARADSVHFVIRSATRNFDYQKGIWERKWSGKTPLENNTKATTMADYRDRALTILRYSSMPGSSRHHWGTDIDLNSFDNTYFEHGQGKVEYDWLIQHGHRYGFCQPYTKKGANRPHGYEEEKWHWSFYPVSAVLTRAAQSTLRDSMLQGFAGHGTAQSISVVENYVLGINQDCLN